jgi:hypothetical protein
MMIVDDRTINSIFFDLILSCIKFNTISIKLAIPKIAKGQTMMQKAIILVAAME